MIRPGIRRLFPLPRRGAASVRAEVDEEIRLHLQLRAEQLEREGLAPARAREEAARRFGPMDEARRTLRRAAARRETRMSARERIATVGQDLRYAARQLRRAPAFTAVAVLTLALGIGANGALFGVVDRTLLRPLPFADPDRLVMVWETVPSEGIRENTPAPVTLEHWRRGARSFERLAPFTTAFTNLSGGGEPERLRALRVSAELLPTLGVAPARGRGFTREEDRAGGPRAVLLSDALWGRRFGRDPGVVGAPVRLDGEAVRVVGVLPPEVPLPIESDVWVPLALSPEEARSESRMLWVVGRLRPGIAPAAAQAEMDALMRGERNGLGYGIGGQVVPLEETLRGDVRGDLLLVFAVTGVVLLIACANVAMMMLARATARRRELAVRSALGASRGRIARQLLVESLALGACGGAAGLLLAFGLLRALEALRPDALAAAFDAGVDARVLAFTLALSVATAVLFGLAPVLGAVRGGAVEIRTGSRAVGGEGRRPARGLLVAGEMALAVVLLAAAGLLLRGLVTVLGTPTGYDPGASSPSRWSGPIRTRSAAWPSTTSSCGGWRRSPGWRRRGSATGSRSASRAGGPASSPRTTRRCRSPATTAS